MFLALFLQATKLVHLNHMHSDGGGWGVGDEEEEKRRETERERENHSPSTVGKANDLSQPLLSPRLAERKLPAVPQAFVTDYNLLKISTRNTHRKKSGCTCPRLQQLYNYLKERQRGKILKNKNKIKRKREEETGFDPCSVELQPGVLPTTLRRS